MRKNFFVFIVFFTLFLFGNENIPDELNYKLQQIPLSPSSYSIYVKAVNSDTPMVSWNSYKPRVPASVIKLLTTYSGLLELGYNYRWETKFYSTGYINNGTLRGDLIVKASGDPTLGTKDLDDIVTHLHQLGIRKILGNIVIDRTLFSVPQKNSSGFDRNRYSPYNAMPDSMMFNERVTTLNINTINNHVVVTKETADNSFDIINNAKVIHGSCRGDHALVKVKIDKNYPKPKVFVSGKLSNRCGTIKICKVITKPYKTFYYSLKSALSDIGIKNNSNLKLSSLPLNAKILFIYKSKRLEETISIINKESNNLMARQLMLTLGAYIYNSPSNIYKGRNAIKKILSDNGIKLGNNTLIDNGCGLSRISKVKASDITKILISSFNKFGYRWLNTLSIAGVDGTTKKRFKNSIVTNRGWFKTGTIKSVKNIIGYVKSNSGRLYSVVILVNHPKSYQGASLQNDIIKFLTTL